MHNTQGTPSHTNSHCTNLPHLPTLKPSQLGHPTTKTTPTTMTTPLFIGRDCSTTIASINTTRRRRGRIAHVCVAQRPHGKTPLANKPQGNKEQGSRHTAHSSLMTRQHRPGRCLLSHYCKANTTPRRVMATETDEACFSKNIYATWCRVR